MKLKYVLIIGILILVTGCVHRKIDVQDMIAEMKQIQSTNRRAVINILWYEGTDAEFHYFSYVYAMVGGKQYKVPKDQLIIDEMMPLTKKDDMLIYVREIDNQWFASRLKNGIWVEDKEGIHVKLKPN